jgi:hypothetical protein
MLIRHFFPRRSCALVLTVTEIFCFQIRQDKKNAISGQAQIFSLIGFLCFVPRSLLVKTARAVPNALEISCHVLYR